MQNLWVLNQDLDFAIYFLEQLKIKDVHSQALVGATLARVDLSELHLQKTLYVIPCISLPMVCLRQQWNPPCRIIRQ